jgi:Ala-tRNA(Pro) deacylase
MCKVEKFLKENNLDYELYEHPPVRTCEEAEIHCEDVPGMPLKNLFLIEKGGERVFLVVIPVDERADLKKLADIVAVKKVTFGSAELLMELFHVEPGAVSLFGLLNDTKSRVEVYIDNKVLKAGKVNLHPNRNTASVVLDQKMLENYIAYQQNKIVATNLT